MTETNAQTLGWDSAGQLPPYDGQLRLDVYTDLSTGANMVEYWHWHSIHAGQETYWKGVLSHDLEPNRAYAEVCTDRARTAEGRPESSTSKSEIRWPSSTASIRRTRSASCRSNGSKSWDGCPAKPRAAYNAIVSQLHRSLYQANVGADFVFPRRPADFSQYKLLIVPALYVADDALLKKISDYVQDGGHVLMTFKSGFTNENSAVRWERAPGPLREAAGFTYQEFSNLEHPLALKDDPLHSLPQRTRSARGRSFCCRLRPSRSRSTIIRFSGAGRPLPATSSARAC